MENKKDNESGALALLKQFIKFGIVGVSNTLISMAVYYIFIWINPELYLIGESAGFVLGTLNAYYWNNRYVFKAGNTGHLKRLLKTFLAYGATYLLGLLILYLLKDKAKMSVYIIQVIKLAVTIPLNFLLNKFWAMKKKDGEKSNE